LLTTGHYLVLTYCLVVRPAGLEPATDGLEDRRRRATRLNRVTPYGTTGVHISPGQSAHSQPKPEQAGSTRRGAVGGVPEGFCLSGALPRAPEPLRSRRYAAQIRLAVAHEATGLNAHRAALVGEAVELPVGAVGLEDG
jgi:hypothetical protein